MDKKPEKTALLTKEFLLSLKEGHYLVSNTKKNRKPIFEESVSPMDKREAQWQRIKEAEAHQRLCFVYENRSGQ